MRIALLNPPLREPHDPARWITVPPAGYGGIQWVVAHLIDGLLAVGHEVVLLGAPGSDAWGKAVEVVDSPPLDGIVDWLQTNRVDILHDHSNACIPLRELEIPFISTHHLTGRPRIEQNIVYLSQAQRAASGRGAEPVIRIAVNPQKFRFEKRKEPYLITLARISRWKGILEAADFAQRAGMKLVVAGPAWEPEYFQEIMRTYPDTVEYRGEVGGAARLELLANATAALVFSRSCIGPWGDRWVESGATVVAEAAASGTPVIASDNGCLAEIVPLVGTIIPEAQLGGSYSAADILRGLPAPTTVRAVAETNWSHRQAAESYTQLYQQITSNQRWNPNL